MNKPRTLLSLVLIALSVIALGVSSAQPTPTRVAWKDIKTWGVQYRDFRKDDLTEVAAVNLDLVVLGRFDGWGREWKTSNIRATKRNKWMLGYISAGQAQPFEWYWKREWGIRPPEWKLLPVTRFGSFNVKYWHPEWQQIVLRTIDRIVASGFDGMFIDQADPYWNAGFPGKASRQNQIRSFELVCRMSRYARNLLPGFKIVINGTADLLDYPGYTRCIDGMAAEHLWQNGNGIPGDGGYREYVLEQLPKALKAGLKVFTFDYSSDPIETDEVLQQSSSRGFIPFVGEHGLGKTPGVFLSASRR
jgi:cysteinyl-tRNA synthetase